MLEIERVNSNDTKSMFNIINGEEIYSLLLDKKNIGYGIIRNNNECKIEVYILEEYQGNGYGSFLFKELLKKIKKDINLKIDISNVIIKRIIENNNGIELGRDGQFIYYIIKNKPIGN